MSDNQIQAAKGVVLALVAAAVTAKLLAPEVSDAAVGVTTAVFTLIGVLLPSPRS